MGSESLREVNNILQEAYLSLHYLLQSGRHRFGIATDDTARTSVLRPAINILHVSEQTGGTWWRSWLRHCTKSRNVAGSIPDGVIRIIP